MCLHEKILGVQNFWYGSNFRGFNFRTAVGHRKLNPVENNRLYGMLYTCIHTSILFITSASLFTIVAITFLIIQIVMTIVTFVYIKKHTLEGSVQLKKAVAKVLVYIFIASIVTLIMAPVLSFILHLIIPGYTTVTSAARGYLSRLLLGVPGIATPLVSIALLKPVRIAIKTIPKNLFCKKDDQIHFTGVDGAIELQTSSV